jgi:aminoglycoside-2''-adenylyltransferase
MKADDVRTILRALNDANVRYLIVGGLAVVAHGYVRFTQDIDLVVQLERENVLRAMNALTAIGYRPLMPVEAAQFADERLRQQWRDEKGMIVFQLFDPQRESTRVDIFVSEPFAFAQEFQAAIWHTWGELRAPVLRIEALIVMKEAARRPQDLADAALLRDILKVQREESAP